MRAALPILAGMPYRIRIDRLLCTGYGECVGIAPEVFDLGADNISIVLDPEGADDETILDAARACPVDAITLTDEYDEQVWPAL
jgi:ferredoxin